MSNLRKKKNVMRVCRLSPFPFIVVLNADSFFTNLALNCSEKRHTHFINIPAFSSQRYLILGDFAMIDACNRTCNGFAYRCEKYDFDLDVYCSLIPDIINHDGHEHQLILSSTSDSDKYSSCDSNKEELMFRCADCEFTLHFKCATLSHTIRYGPYEQPFILCYKDEDSSSDEYFCDICEEERNPKHAFYYCADLNFLAHPNCIFEKLSYMKSVRHEHPLKLVDKCKGANCLCDECGSLCYALQEN